MSEKLILFAFYSGGRTFVLGFLLYHNQKYSLYRVLKIQPDNHQDPQVGLQRGIISRGIAAV
ncbi:Uncharacterised protein [Streptococcus mutans]|uniref:Uncharacterized protein n=1 Tax=Streptococcus ratti FA-1 = DSM 20564 TaxID=699248 RepID=A0ABP2QWN4_STRRT|nr:hypothetical protein SRA_02921 [Streptococcus ratti FA-1 = DSM 20564]VEI59778.1 Uncharacterised protein [Streptococcus mutans]